MKRIYAIMTLLAASCLAVTAQDKVVRLYPEGQNSDKGIEEKGVAITGGPQESNGFTQPEGLNKSGSALTYIGDNARIEFYFPKKQKSDRMVMVFPGGGYKQESIYGSGAYTAKWFASQGIPACVLFYRLPNHHYRIPMIDVENAMRYCRYHSKEWGVNKIGVIGFSAGGHLAGCAATMYSDSLTRPDFAILCYARLWFDKGVECTSKDYLIGPDEMWENDPEEHARLIKTYCPENHIDKNTCPTFIAHSADDRSVPPDNFFGYCSKLMENDLPYEVHVFPTGGHGWGFKDPENKESAKSDKLSPYRQQFNDCLLRWLKEL